MIVSIGLSLHSQNELKQRLYGMIWLRQNRQPCLAGGGASGADAPRPELSPPPDRADLCHSSNKRLTTFRAFAFRNFIREDLVLFAVLGEISKRL